MSSSGRLSADHSSFRIQAAPSEQGAVYFSILSFHILNHHGRETLQNVYKKIGFPIRISRTFIKNMPFYKRLQDLYKKNAFRITISDRLSMNQYLSP